MKSDDMVSVQERGRARHNLLQKSKWWKYPLPLKLPVTLPSNELKAALVFIANDLQNRKISVAEWDTCNSVHLCWPIIQSSTEEYWWRCFWIPQGDGNTLIVLSRGISGLRPTEPQASLAFCSRADTTYLQCESRATWDQVNTAKCNTDEEKVWTWNLDKNPHPKNMFGIKIHSLSFLTAIVWPPLRTISVSFWRKGVNMWIFPSTGSKQKSRGDITMANLLMFLLTYIQMAFILS